MREHHHGIPEWVLWLFAMAALIFSLLVQVDL